MTDDQVSQAEFGAQVLKQVQDLRLDRNIKCTCRFVAYDDLWPVDEGASNRHALPLTAGKLVRVIVERAAGQADQLHDFFRAALPCVGVRVALYPKRKRDDVAYRLARIKRGVRVLEDGLQQLRNFHPVDASDRLSVDPDCAGGWRQQAQHHFGQRRFSASGLAHEPKNLTGLNGERYAVDCVQRLFLAHEATADHERACDFIDFQCRIAHAANPLRRFLAVCAGESTQRYSCVLWCVGRIAILPDSHSTEAYGQRLAK